MVRWHEGESTWEVALPYYSLHPEHEYIWTSLPNRYCITDKLAWAINILLTKYHEDQILNKCQVYFVYGKDSIELTTDDVIMDVLIQYSNI
jgi:hypothetical protein